MNFFTVSGVAATRVSSVSAGTAIFIEASLGRREDGDGGRQSLGQEERHQDEQDGDAR